MGGAAPAPPVEVPVVEVPVVEVPAVDVPLVEVDVLEEEEIYVAVEETRSSPSSWPPGSTIRTPRVPRMGHGGPGHRVTRTRHRTHGRRAQERPGPRRVRRPKATGRNAPRPGQSKSRSGSAGPGG